MIKTKLDKSQNYLIGELEEKSPNNVFLIERAKKFYDYIEDDSVYCIVYYSGWYGDHVKIISEIFNNTVIKFGNVKFGFKVFTEEGELKEELKELYLGSIGKTVFIFIKGKEIVEYLESNLNYTEVDKILHKLIS